MVKKSGTAFSDKIAWQYKTKTVGSKLEKIRKEKELSDTISTFNVLVSVVYLIGTGSPMSCAVFKYLRRSSITLLTTINTIMGFWCVIIDRSKAIIRCKLSKNVNKPFLDPWTEPFFSIFKRRRVSIGFPGFGISLIWNSVFGIFVIWNSVSGFFLFEARVRDFPYLKLEIWVFKARSRRDSGLIVCLAGGMSKTILRITGLPEILGQDYGIEERYRGPSKRRDNRAYSKLIFFLFLTAVFSWWRFGEAQEAFIVIQSSSHIQSKNAGIPGNRFCFVSSMF